MGHYYERDGESVEPRHFVPMASRPDELRPTRITDVRKWWKDGRLVVPSVTTVLDTLNKWGLNNWRIDQHLLVAHDMPQGLSVEEYLAEVKRRTEMEMDKAPSAGTDFHAAIEAYVSDEPVPEGMGELCDRVWAETEKHLPPHYDYGAEVRFASELGFGGCTDLVAYSQQTNADYWIIDYKTKREASKFKPGKMAYDEHRMQLAAYREGLELGNARCANVFVCLEDGQVDFHEHTEKDLIRGWQMFSHALEIWKLQNNYPELEAV